VEARHLALVLSELDEYDVVHDNSTVYGPLLLSQCGKPVVHTVHGGLDDEDARAVYAGVCDEVALVAISESYRDKAPELTWEDAIPNPVDIHDYPLVEQKDDYVVFMARMSPVKGPDVAIRAAVAAGLEIVVAGPVHAPDREYFKREVEPLLDEPGVTLVGPVGGQRKADLLAHARALISPVSWDEPFGLAPVEAMACGTPVVAFPRGALCETVAHGETGLLVETEEELAGALEDVTRIDPRACRRRVEQRFSVECVSELYEAVLKRVTVRGKVGRFARES
jgi:glycosyltransferase involved in cell wall biosynthesis